MPTICEEKDPAGQEYALDYDPPPFDLECPPPPPGEAQEGDIITSISWHQGWNAVSTPVLLPGNNSPIYSDIFPDAIPGAAYGFLHEQSDYGFYYPALELEPGRGYWVRMSQAGSRTFTTPQYDEIATVTIPMTSRGLAGGWNLIGGISSVVNLSQVEDPDGIIVSDSLFGFDGNYQYAYQIIMGKGYWLRANADGEITLGTV